jgi:hemerythrin-like domain-containing protein
MCEHCGCRQVAPLGELMDEHLALLDLAADVRAALGRDDRAATVELLGRFAHHLGSHVRREEDGVFTAIRDTGEYVEEIDDLERDHADFDAQIAALDLDHPDVDAHLTSLFTHLSEHIDREDLGIFPVSVVTLGAQGWDTVARAHREQPTFL